MVQIRVDILHGVFSYFNRSDLGRFCTVSRTFLEIIERHFSSAPYYLISDMRLLTYQSNRTYNTSGRTKGEFLELSYSHPVTKLTVYGTFTSLLPFFLAQTVRVRRFVLMAFKQEVSPPISAIVDAVQQLSHCWQSYDCSPNYTFTLNLTIIDDETREWNRDLLFLMSKCWSQDGQQILGNCAQLEISGCMGTSLFEYESAYPLLHSFTNLSMAGETERIGGLASYLSYLNQPPIHVNNEKKYESQSLVISALNKSVLEIHKNKQAVANFFKQVQEDFMLSNEARSYTLKITCYPDKDRNYKEVFGSTAPFAIFNATTREKLQLQANGPFTHILSRCFIDFRYSQLGSYPV